jgi:hypothetical protein
MSNAFWVTLAVTGAVYVPLFWWMIRTFRHSSRKAMVKRRLLVKVRLCAGIRGSGLLTGVSENWRSGLNSEVGDG